MEAYTGPTFGSIEIKPSIAPCHNHDITQQKLEDKCKEWGSCEPLICLFRLINMYSTTGDTEENNAICQYSGPFIFKL